jgi:hypothetical protein
MMHDPTTEKTPDIFPQPGRNDGGKPCGECHLQLGETCNICGAVRMDDCERAACTSYQWPDGTRVSEKQRAYGMAFSERVNAARQHCPMM